MNRYSLSYHYNRPPKRLQSASLGNIAIIPASLLFRNKRVNEVANKLPIGSVLICSSAQEKTRRTLAAIASYFRNHGHHVMTIPASRL